MALKTVSAEVITVAQDGNGHYTGLAQALAAAQEGDTIQIGPGTYKEALIISKNNLRLEGAGYAATRLIVRDNFGLKLQNVTKCKIQGLHLSTQSPKGYATLLANNSELTLRHCLISSDPSGYGVFCMNKTSLVMDHTTLVNNGQGGAIVFDQTCRVQVKNSIIANNAAGIVYRGKGACPAEMDNNDIWGNTKDYVNCTPHGANFSVNPQFTNPQANDYRPQKGSNLLKKGTDGLDIGAAQSFEGIKPAKAKPAAPKPQSEEEPVSETDGEADTEEAPEEEAEPELNPEMDMDTDTAIETHYTPEIEPELKVKADEEEESETETKSEPETEPEPEAETEAAAEPSATTASDQPVKEILPANPPSAPTPATVAEAKPEVTPPATTEPPASLELSANLEAAAYLDDTYLGTVPLKKASLTAGTHALKLTSHKGNEILLHRSDIVLKPGDNRLEIDTFEHRTPPPGMAYVQAGEFRMGSDQGESDERPVHTVWMDDFYIDRHEATVRQYLEYLEANGKKIPEELTWPEFSNPTYPATWVSWDEASGYCKWAGKSLPTEAQWEKAARGSDLRTYPWGNDFDRDKVNVIINLKFIQPTGSYPAGISPYGAEDTAGNVWEWCADWYQADYYAQGQQLAPKGPTTGTQRVLRGGSFDSPAYDVRTSRRGRSEPDTRRHYIGFRCIWQP